MRSFRIVVTAGLLFAGGKASQAAQFSAVELLNGRGPAILMTGEIVAGDETAFHTLAETLPKAIVLTTGPGGRVSPALKIGREIRVRGWSTLVPPGDKCASACSLIWLAGDRRMLGANAQIGFHATSVTSKDGQRIETHDSDAYLRAWLTELGFPLDTTATMVNTRAASIRWYDANELQASGIPTGSYP